jgi:hypothetical protein
VSIGRKSWGGTENSELAMLKILSTGSDAWWCYKEKKECKRQAQTPRETIMRFTPNTWS